MNDTNDTRKTTGASMTFNRTERRATLAMIFGATSCAMTRALLCALAFALALALATAGCTPATAPGSRISATRVLGARIEAAGDPSRVWPRPGETANVAWLLVGPAAPRPLDWSFFVVACAVTQDLVGCLAAGQAAPLAKSSGASDGTTPPSLDLAVPDATTLSASGANRLAIGGVICAGGVVADPTGAVWSRCDSTATDGGGASDETDVALTLSLQTGADGDAPPTLSDDPFTWNAAPWTTGAGDTANAGGGAPCANDPTLPQVAAGAGAQHVVVTADAADRETIPADTTAPATPATLESLQLSALGTLGAFDTQFAAVAPTDTSPTSAMKLDWTPPTHDDVAVPAAGLTVRFVFVLRDLRGGIDWQTRTACLLPAGSSATSSP